MLNFRFKKLQLSILFPITIISFEGCKKHVYLQNSKLDSYSNISKKQNETSIVSYYNDNIDIKIEKFKYKLKLIEKGFEEDEKNSSSIPHCKRMIEIIENKLSKYDLISAARLYLNELKIDSDLKFYDIVLASLSTDIITSFSEGETSKSFKFNQNKIYVENIMKNYPLMVTIFREGMCHGLVQMTNIFEKEREGSSQNILKVIKKAAKYLSNRNIMRSEEGDKILFEFIKTSEVLKEISEYQLEEGFEEIIPPRGSDLNNAFRSIEPNELLDYIDNDYQQKQGETFVVGMYLTKDPVITSGHDISIIKNGAKYTIFDPNLGFYYKLDRYDAELILKMLQIYSITSNENRAENKNNDGLWRFKELRSAERYYTKKIKNKYNVLINDVKNNIGKLNKSIEEAINNNPEFEEPWEEIPDFHNFIHPENTNESFNYDHQIILQLQGDNTSFESAKRLFFKHPHKSEWVQANNISMDSYAFQDETIIKKNSILDNLPKAGKIRIVIVGHGRITKNLKLFNNSVTLFGGNTREELEEILNNLFKEMSLKSKSEIREVHIDLVGCQLDPTIFHTNIEETFAGRIAVWLKNKATELNIPRNALSVRARNFDISILSDGRKNYSDPSNGDSKRIKRMNDEMSKSEYYWENDELKFKSIYIPKKYNNQNDIGKLNANKNISNIKINNQIKSGINNYLNEYDLSQLEAKEFIEQTKKVLKIKNDFNNFIHEQIQNLTKEEKYHNWKVVTDKDSGNGILINEYNERKILDCEDTRYKSFVETKSAIIRIAEPKFLKGKFIHSSNRLGSATLNAFALFSLISSDQSHASQFMKFTTATNLGLSATVDASDLYIYASNVSNYLPELSALKSFSKIGGEVSLGLGSVLTLVSLISDSIQLGNATNDLQKLQAELAIGGDLLGATGLIVPALMGLTAIEAAAGPVGLVIAASTVIYSEIRNLIIEGKEDFLKFNSISNIFQKIMDDQKEIYSVKNNLIQIKGEALVNEVNLETGDIKFGKLISKNENNININKVLTPKVKKISPNEFVNNKFFIVPYNLDQTFYSEWTTRTIDILGEYSLYPSDSFNKITNKLNIWNKNGRFLDGIYSSLYDDIFGIKKQNVLIGKFEPMATEKKITFAKNSRAVVIPNLAVSNQKDKLSFYFVGNGSINTIILGDTVSPIKIKSVQGDNWIFNADNFITDSPRLGEVQKILIDFNDTLLKINSNADIYLNDYQTKIDSNGLLGKLWQTSDGGFWDPLFPSERNNKKILDIFKQLYQNNKIDKILHLKKVQDLYEYHKILKKTGEWIKEINKLGNYDNIFKNTQFNMKLNKTLIFFENILSDYEGEKYSRYNININSIEYNKNKSTLKIGEQEINIEGDFRGTIVLTFGILNNDLKAKPKLLLSYDKENNCFKKNIALDETTSIAENMKSLEWVHRTYADLNLNNTIATGSNGLIDFKNKITIDTNNIKKLNTTKFYENSISINLNNIEKKIYFGNSDKPIIKSVTKISEKVFVIKNFSNETLFKFKIKNNRIHIISILDFVLDNTFEKIMNERGINIIKNFMIKNSLNDNNFDTNLIYEIYTNNKKLIKTNFDTILLEKYDNSEIEYSFTKNILTLRISKNIPINLYNKLQLILEKYNPEIIIVPDIILSKINLHSLSLDNYPKLIIYGPYLNLSEKSKDYF